MGTTWRGALVVSVAVHAVMLLAIGMWAVNGGERAGDRVASPGIAAAVELSTLVDLASVDTISPLELAPAAASTLPPDLSTAVLVADQSHATSEAASSPRAGGLDRRKLAPDRGAGVGKTADDPAWRRDATTLHERLSDGAEVYQPSHARTAWVATSRQAVRREPDTGIADSTQTRRPRRAPIAASYGVVDPDGIGMGVATTEGSAAEAAALAMDRATPQAPRAILASEGPLDADQGTRSFDVETPGFVAADNRALRVASHEDHPGITDLTLSAVSGNDSQGRGPSDMPGAVARPTAGAAASPAGARGVSGAVGDSQSAQERRYDRYKREIGDRVNRALVYPRGLAVRLEQGETILHFVVRPDGKLGDSIRVIKSSGFVEFDQAALDAVRKALPFRPMSDSGREQSLVVTLPVTFSNPVIR